eukprot:5575849-Pleurochrysis_carterae.AAC.1
MVRCRRGSRQWSKTGAHSCKLLERALKHSHHRAHSLHPVQRDFICECVDVEPFDAISCDVMLAHLHGFKANIISCDAMLAHLHGFKANIMLVVTRVGLYGKSAPEAR